MAKFVIRALQGNATSFNLSSKKLDHVPKSVSRLKHLSTLLLNNNFITTLPEEFLSLQHVSLASELVGKLTTCHTFPRFHDTSLR